MRFTTVAFTLLLAICADAQWTVVNLHPAGTSSFGEGVGGGQQMGTVGGLLHGPHASMLAVLSGLAAIALRRRKQ